MDRAYYSDTIDQFLNRLSEEILGQLVLGARADGWGVEAPQTDAWLEQIALLKTVFKPYRNDGAVYFEYSIPRLGGRIDVVALIRSVIFVIEFKVGEDEFTPSALDQASDYALDLKNFHETSHELPIAPVLIPTRAQCNACDCLYRARR